jgi:hypothetical protein
MDAPGDERMHVNDWVCGNCKSINRGSANSCYSCGGSREIVAVSETRPLGAPTYAPPAPVAPSAGAATFAAADGQPGVAATTMPGFAGVGALGVPSAEAQPRQPATTKDIVGGLGAGLVAAILATAIWYAVVTISHYQLGIVAIVVGFLVGQGVVLGASRRGSPVLIAISVGLTALALVMSEYLIVVHFVNEELAAEGAFVDVIQPASLMAEVVVESVKADPLTLAFWAIALFQAFTIPARQLGRSRS